MAQEKHVILAPLVLGTAAWRDIGGSSLADGASDVGTQYVRIALNRKRVIFGGKT
jgi:hypothetical protein